MKSLLLLASILLALTACSGESPTTSDAVIEPSAAVSAKSDPAQKINAELHRHIAELASDA